MGFVLVGVIMSGMMIFIAGGETYYSMNDYDNDTFSSFDKLIELDKQVKTFDDKGDDVNSDSSLLDVLGNFFTNMFTASKTFKASADVMTDFVDDGVGKLPIGDTFSATLKSGLVLIFMIILSVGIFLAFVTKSERT
jgi:hypothetical protein